MSYRSRILELEPAMPHSTNSSVSHSTTHILLITLAHYAQLLSDELELRIREWNPKSEDRVLSVEPNGITLSQLEDPLTKEPQLEECGITPCPSQLRKVPELERPEISPGLSLFQEHLSIFATPSEFSAGESKPDNSKSVWIQSFLSKVVKVGIQLKVLLKELIRAIEGHLDVQVATEAEPGHTAALIAVPGDFSFQENPISMAPNKIYARISLPISRVSPQAHPRQHLLAKESSGTVIKIPSNSFNAGLGGKKSIQLSLAEASTETGRNLNTQNGRSVTKANRVTTRTPPAALIRRVSSRQIRTILDGQSLIISAEEAADWLYANCMLNGMGLNVSE